MKPCIYRLVVVGLPIFLCALPGCERSPMKTAPVKGKITFNGKSIARGVVMFVPIRPGPTAMGQIDSDGNYLLTTFKNGDGAVLGTHLVVVDAKGDERPNDGGATPPAIVPDKYLSHATTDLRAEVEEGENTKDFNLTGALFKSRPVKDAGEFGMKKRKAAKKGESAEK